MRLVGKLMVMVFLKDREISVQTLVHSVSMVPQYGAMVPGCRCIKWQIQAVFISASSSQQKKKMCTHEIGGSYLHIIVISCQV